MDGGRRRRRGNKKSEGRKKWKKLDYFGLLWIFLLMCWNTCFQRFAMWKAMRVERVKIDGLEQIAQNYKKENTAFRCRWTQIITTTTTSNNWKPFNSNFDVQKYLFKICMKLGKTERKNKITKMNTKVIMYLCRWSYIKYVCIYIIVSQIKRIATHLEKNAQTITIHTNNCRRISAHLHMYICILAYIHIYIYKLYVRALFKGE